MGVSRRELAGAILVVAGSPGLALAKSADPAASRIEAFYGELLALMKSRSATPARLRPIIDRTFNLSVMAQFAVGPAWATMTPTDHSELVTALSRYTATRYARDFSSFNGQAFVVEPVVQARGPDRLVKSEVREAGEAPARLNYRLREYEGAWRAIDVYYNGVSELATQRADFAEALSSGGASNLVRKLDEATAKLK